jgi:4-cresol dehydrogenase (hydroxylating) flavoprotein subunit
MRQAIPVGAAAGRLMEIKMEAAIPNAREFPDLAENLPRRVSSTVAAASVEDVRRAVLAAAATKSPLYPVSRGLNWGLGSKNPVKQDCTLLDLSRLNKIRSIDLDRGYAAIESGVSQGELADALQDTPFLLNVTTSARESSVVGNALDRGQGMIRLRAHDLLGLEAVLADGTVMTTGVFGEVAGRSMSAVMAGPDLTKLFCHSNFGVVTAATISLVRRPERTAYVYGAYEGTAMPRVVDALYRLRQDGVFRTMFYLGEMEMTPGAGSQPAFTVLGPLMGRAAMVAEAERIVRAELEPIPGCVSLRSGRAQDVPPEDRLHLRARMYLGEPTTEMIKQRFGTKTAALDETSAKGWAVLQVVLPPDGAAVEEAMAIVSRSVDACGMAAHPHLSTVSSRSINLMVMIWFDRTPEGSERMRGMRDQLRQALIERGFYPSREGIDALETADQAGRPQDAASRIKAALDPEGVISPGRYV